MPPFPGRRTEPAPEAVSLGGCRWPAADCLPRLGAFRLLFRLGGRSERRVGAGVDLPGKFGEGLGNAVDFVADQEGKEKGQDAPQADSLPQPCTMARRLSAGPRRGGAVTGMAVC